MDEEDDEAEVIEQPKRVKKPMAKKKEKIPWVGVVEEPEEPQEEEEQEQKAEAKPMSIVWPSSVSEPSITEKKQTPPQVVEEKKAAEDQEYLEFQKYQDNIRAAHWQTEYFT